MRIETRAAIALAAVALAPHAQAPSGDAARGKAALREEHVLHLPRHAGRGGDRGLAAAGADPFRGGVRSADAPPTRVDARYAQGT